MVVDGNKLSFAGFLEIQIIFAIHLDGEPFIQIWEYIGDGCKGRERERERERERAAVSFGSYDSEEEEALINDCHHEHEGYITT